MWAWLSRINGQEGQGIASRSGSAHGDRRAAGSPGPARRAEADHRRPQTARRSSGRQTTTARWFSAKEAAAPLTPGTTYGPR